LIVLPRPGLRFLWNAVSYGCSMEMTYAFGVRIGRWFIGVRRGEK
jgi:hypothetical protein